MSEGACLFLFCRRGDSPQRKKDIGTPRIMNFVIRDKASHVYFASHNLFYPFRPPNLAASALGFDLNRCFFAFLSDSFSDFWFSRHGSRRHDLNYCLSLDY